MRTLAYRVFGDTIVARLPKGSEVLAGIAEICEKEGVQLAEISAIGAVDKITVGLYNVEEQKYHSNTFEDEMEMTGLLGTATRKDGQVYLHLHGSFSDVHGHTFGGHVNQAFISATCEVVIRRIAGEIGRRYDPETGLFIMDID